MFSTRLNVSLRSSKACARLSILSGPNNRRTFRRFVKSTNIANEKITSKFDDSCHKNSHHRAKYLISFFEKFSLNDDYLPNFQLQFVRYYSSDSLSKRANVFGELSDRQFEKFEMDEDEKKEEKFVENEARVLRCNRLTPGGYADLIKSHIEKRNLDDALKVLDQVAENRDEPTTYMYNLLLRAFAVVGNLKQSRKLYIAMKKRGLKCNDATYTSIINACANYHHSPTALDYIADLRQEFVEKSVVLNETHYNTMIKAYSRHGDLIEAFAIADVMRDKHLSTNEITFNSLLIGTISDREAGLRHALVIWHMMRRHAIKPTIKTYNLLLRAIRDTKLGDLRVNDVLISAPPQCQISLDNSTRPDLLSRSPSVNSLIFTEIVRTNDEIMEENKTADDVSSNEATLSSNEATLSSNEAKLSSNEATLSSKEANLTTEISTKEQTLPSTIEPTSGEKSLVDKRTMILNTRLQTIHNKNRLILFGGLSGIFETMDQDGVVPDTKSITLLMELMPPSSQCERNLLKTAKTKRVPLDIDFYNMLMKKRSLRRDYAGAKEILDDIQRSGHCADIITWGILALGCTTSEEARELIDGMRATGHRLNVVIAGTLINNACRKIRFGYILEMMETMLHYRIKPNWELYCALDTFQKEMKEKIKSKKFSRMVNHPAFKTGFSKFNLRYPTWRKEMESKIENKPKTKTRQR